MYTLFFIRIHFRVQGSFNNYVTHMLGGGCQHFVVPSLFSIVIFYCLALRKGEGGLNGYFLRYIVIKWPFIRILRLRFSSDRHDIVMGVGFTENRKMALFKTENRKMEFQGNRKMAFFETEIRISDTPAPSPLWWSPWYCDNHPWPTLEYGLISCFEIAFHLNVAI